MTTEGNAGEGAHQSRVTIEGNVERAPIKAA